MSGFPIEPPRELLMPASLQQVSLWMAGLACAAFALFALWQLLRHREPLALFCLLGGLATSLTEPVCDVIGLIYHPEIGQIVGFEALGRKIPLHVVALLAAYYAFFGWLLSGPVGARMTRAGFWKLFVGLWVFSTLLEIGPVQGGLWVYYGTQPFTVAGMPLWWFFVNAMSALAGAGLAALGTRSRIGWQRWPVALLLPVGAVGAHAGCSLPTYLAIHSGWSLPAVTLAGALTLAYALAVLAVVAGQLFPARRMHS